VTDEARSDTRVEGAGTDEVVPQMPTCRPIGFRFGRVNEPRQDGCKFTTRLEPDHEKLRKLVLG